MNRLMSACVTLVVVSFLAAASPSRAEMAPGEHPNGSLGFHRASAPIGVRWWLSGQKVGLDLGLGFDSEPAPGFSGEKLSSWEIDAGVPFVMHSWNRAHVLFRPGLRYSSQQFQDAGALPAFDTEDETTLGISAEIEAEIFLVDNFSVSASHGLEFVSVDPPGPGDSVTSFRTIGNNFTEVGFHIYFFGGGQ